MRNAPLTFRFDGQTLPGFRGDTLASALLANGVRLVGRSFKYHRPRGLLTAGPEEPNGLVELRSGARREPNTRATVAELYDGLEASSQNRWPSLAFDLLSINSLFAPALTAGFYYKTFMWPASFWERLYEPAIRRAAGLGRAANAEDPDIYEKAFALRRRSSNWRRTGRAFRRPRGRPAPGASASSSATTISSSAAGFCRSGARSTAIPPRNGWPNPSQSEALSRHSHHAAHRCYVGVYDHGVYGALERVADHLASPSPHQPRQRAWRIVAKRAILAAGAS